MRIFLLVLIVLIVSCTQSPEVLGQAVQQSGTVVNGHTSTWVTNGVIRDAGTSTGTNYLNTLGITADGGSPFCINSAAPTTSAYTQFCIGTSSVDGTYITSTPYGAATSLPFSIKSNGNTVFSCSASGCSMYSSGSTPLTGVLYGNGASPMTSYLPSPLLDLLGSTPGSVMARNASTWASTSAGTSGQVLMSNGTSLPSWSAVSGVQSTVVYALRVVTAAGGVTVTSADTVIVINKASAATTLVTLPSSPTGGTIVIIKDGKGDSETYAITVDAGVSNTIDGSRYAYLNNNYASLTIVWNGTQWNVL